MTRRAALGQFPAGTVPLNSRGLSRNGTVPLRKTQRGYLLVMVVVMLFLVASIAILLNFDSSISANTTSGELEAARAEYVAQAGLQHALWRAKNNACMGGITIPATSLGTDSYDVNATGAATGTAYTLPADQDAWIRSDDVTKTNGGTPDLHIRFESGNVEQALIRFDLSSLPADAQISSATAWFYVSTGGASGGMHPEGPLTVHRVTADWTENGTTAATWENMNGNFEISRLATIAAQPDDGVWVSINLTAQAQAWVNGQPNYGILFASESEGVHAKYASIDGGAATRPYLDVVVGSGPSSPATVKATGTLANGIKRKLKDKLVIAYQPPGTATLQLGTDPGEDTILDSFYSARNYGGASYIQVNDNGSDWQQYPLIRFDLGRVPWGAAVRSARLELHTRNAASGTATVHQVTRGWVEGTKSGGGIADGASWFTYDGTNTWTSAGGDINAAVVAETAINGSETWVSWEIAPLVERWLAGEPNYGLMIKPASGLSEAEFDSKEGSGVGVAPKLTIQYACECGGACMAPQGIGTITMVVVNPTTLVPADASKKALFESWGYTVDIISESANQATYDAKATASDVFFISETVNSTQVGNKLVNVPIGVVSQDGDYNSDLGLAGGSGWPVSPTINVTDPSHYITAIFPAGPLDIYSAAMEQLTVSGGAALGLTTLADTGGAGSLVALDTGAMLLGGGSAAGRRVMLPLGREGQFNWNYLNGNGQLVVQRALAWAMGADETISGNALLVVVDPDNLTAQEAAKKTLIESWGFAVNLIDESASQAEFDTAIAANDVAYIPQDINSANLGTKLAGAIIGVVNEEGEQVDELGFANDKIFKSRSQVDVIDNTHYITEPFATGLLTFSASDQSVHMLSGGVAAGLHTLGQSFNTGSLWHPSLAVIETGGTLSGSGTAAGRRVQLPWGGGTFDINALTDDGRTIMHRALEWGMGAAAPQVLLLIVVDPTTLTAQEAAKKTLIESWGYTVNLIDESASQAEFDAAAASADVAYVAEEITSGTLGTKLREATIGVVIEEEKITDEFGISSGETTFTEASIEVTDNTHYITAPFSLGAVAFASAAQSVGGRAGTLAPGLTVLALKPSSTTSMLDVIDTGGALFDSGTAAGRRVKLPWGGNALDINSLTPDGQTIMQRAIEWAAGDSGGGGGTYLDEFNAVAYDGSDGSTDWTTAPWQELGDADGPTSGRVQVLSASQCASSNCLRIGGTEVSLAGRGVRREVNLDGVAAAELTFTIAGGGPVTAGLVLSVSDDGGANWTDLQSYTIGSGLPLTPSPQSFDISAYASATTQVRFVGSGTPDDTAYGFIDNVRIEIGNGGGGGGGGGGPISGYFDQFNSRDCAAADFAGSDGALDWSPWAWAETGESSSSCSGLIQVVDDAAVPDPGSFRMMLDERNRRVDRLLDLSAFSTATLSFDYRLYNYPTSSDSLVVIASSDGTNWQKLAVFTGIVSMTDYQTATYDITPFIGANAGIGFMTEGINTIQTAYIDNVRIVGDGGGGGGGGSSCKGTFRDEFNARTFTGSDGTLTWAGDWTEVGESDGPTSGDTLVTNDQSNYQLRTRDNNNGGEGVEREADLSGAATATLSYDYRRQSLDNSNDYTSVEVSASGTAGPWTELTRHDGTGNDSSYQLASHDISAYISNNTAIRFKTSPNMGGSDIVWFDNIQIACTP